MDAPKAGSHHEIGAAALFPVGYLAGQDAGQLLSVHARPGQHAGALDKRAVR